MLSDCRQTRGGQDQPDDSQAMLCLVRKPSDTGMVAMQTQDPLIKVIYQFVSAPQKYPISLELLGQSDDLKELYHLRQHLKIENSLLVYTPNDQKIAWWVVPTDHRGVIMMHAHDAPFGGHRSAKATNKTLQRIVYWVGIANDIAEYVKGCLVCCQFQPSTIPTPTSSSSTEEGKLSLVLKSTRGNKYLLLVTCAFTKWVECLPAPNDAAETTAILLVSYIFSRWGLPLSIDSD